ncbi:MAG: hypothetical protein WCG85_21225 [Polyangia bacterium]
MSSPGPNPNPFSDRAANKREEVHFYPGDKILIYLVDGKVKLKTEASGGPPVKEAREPGESMGRAPTYPGVFVIDRIAPYTTKTWSMSEIPWGAKIRESKTRSGGVAWKGQRFATGLRQIFELLPGGRIEKGSEIPTVVRYGYGSNGRLGRGPIVPQWFHLYLGPDGAKVYCVSHQDRVSEDGTGFCHCMRGR